MIKLMIVDDEHIVREGIKFIIENNFDGEIKIVGMAVTGREAIEMFEDKRPSIVLMDIQMPGINGIEAIKSIKEMDSHVKFIIISAYEQFEYAKSAVQLGVRDYILKPINKGKLTENIQRLIREIKEDKKVKQKEIETQEKLDKILPVLEYGYIYSIIMNTDYQKESSDYHNLLDIKKAYAYMMVIELGEGENYKRLSNKIGMGVKGNQQYTAVRNAIKYKCKSVVGPLMVNRITVMVYEDMPENEYSQRVRAIELAEVIYARIKDITDTEVYVGIGSCYKLGRMNISYNEAVKAISKMTDEQVLHITDAVDSQRKSYSFLKIKSDEESIIKRVEEGNVEEVEELLRIFFSKLHKNYIDNIDMLRSISIELMVLIYTTGYRNDSLESSKHTINYVDEIKVLNQFYEFENYCTEKAKDITNNVKQEKENKVSSVISEAMTYIEEKYNVDIRLKDVAEAVAISPQYFSKIFKKELGVNFIDYLTKVRMEQAKTMLKSGSMSIKEICFQIGYNDPNYFSRLFKKVEGVSPTEFH